MSEPRTCDYCGASPPNGYAMLGDKHYCHEGDVPTCYMRAQWVEQDEDEAMMDGLLRVGDHTRRPRMSFISEATMDKTPHFEVYAADALERGEHT